MDSKTDENRGSRACNCYAAFREKCENDLDSIRFAMTQAIETHDTYSTIADKEDEARLDGMRAMLTLFDVTRRQCESR